MMRVVRSELTRLGSMSLVLGGMGLTLFFGLLATAIVLFTASADSSVVPGTEDITMAMVTAPDGMLVGVQTFAGMLGIVSLVVWARSVTSDYSSGLIRLLVQAEPNRLRLLAGKVVALTLFSCGATLVTFMFVLPMAPVVAELAGVSTEAWSGDMLTTVAGGYVQVTAAVLLWGVAGLFLGVLTRSSGIAVGIGIGYLLMFEGVISMAVGSAAKWLPGKAFGAVALGGSPDQSFAAAIAVAVVYAGAALIAAAVVYRRRDITA